MWAFRLALFFLVFTFGILALTRPQRFNVKETITESGLELIIAIADILGVPQVRVDVLLNDYVDFEPPESEIERITIFHTGH